MSVQPIYYSIDEHMCKNVLLNIQKGLLYEIPSFGRECSDLELNKTIKHQMLDDQIEEETEVFNSVTVTLMILILLFLVALVCLQYRNSKEHDR